MWTREAFADSRNWKYIQRLLLNSASQEKSIASRLDRGNCDIPGGYKRAFHPAVICSGSGVNSNPGRIERSEQSGSQNHGAKINPIALPVPSPNVLVWFP